MENNITKLAQQERSNKNPSPQNSPNSNGSSSNNTPPPTPKPNHQITARSDAANPYPTTFVQADTTNFKQVVQMLTGSTETTKNASNPRPSPSSDPPPQPPPQQQQQQQSKNYVIPPIKTTTPKKQSFKLYERRHNSNLKNSLMINTLLPCFASNYSQTTPTSFSPRNKAPEILSPSLLDFPKLALSPVTPLNEDPFNKMSPSLGNYSSSSSSEEEKAIAEKGFYLHPSPMSTPRDSEPQLLALFPVTSPRVSGSS